MKRPLGFLDGIGVGVGALMLLPLLYWVVVRGDFIAMYAQLGSSAKLPAATVLALGPAWSYGAPILLGLGLGLGLAMRPTRWLVFAIGGATLIASGFTFYAAYLPVWQLAGKLTPD